MILILDDHPLSRQGLFSILQSHYKEDETILHAGTVRESIALSERHEVDTVFVDLNLGKESGFDYLHWVQEQPREMRTFVITSSSRQSDFELARQMGVNAYILKDAFIEEIMYGLRVVEQGGRFFSAALVERMSRREEDQNILKCLSEREMDVFVLLSQGFSNAKISEALFISEGTTKKHISNIFSKLDLQSRVEAVLLAQKNSHIIRTAIDRSCKRDMRKEARSDAQEKSAV